MSIFFTICIFKGGYLPTTENVTFILDNKPRIQYAYPDLAASTKTELLEYFIDAEFKFNESTWYYMDNKNFGNGKSIYTERS